MSQHTRTRNRIAKLKEQRCPHECTPKHSLATNPAQAAQPDKPTAADRKCDANADGECTNEPCDSESAEPVPLTPGC